MLIFSKIAQGIFGKTGNRRLKRLQPKIEEINKLESEKRSLSDKALRDSTKEFRKRLSEGETLEDILIPAFATVREASKRVFGMRPFDVQIMGGIVLHEGNIAEMKTGEGKTLAATLPVYLNALAGKGVHVVTVNDYLAKRDSEWMGKLYDFLGLSTGVIVQGLSDEERSHAYRCDITYATNNELGFDYLRDNMKYDRSEMVQRGHYYAIVDEVDSILIDEARTPLIISGQAGDHSELCELVDKFITNLSATDYEIDEKQRTAVFTESGSENLEQELRLANLLKGESLYSAENIGLVHALNNALRAHHLFQKDKDYIVRNDQVVIIDEFTGRMMPGRRYSEGLHQALEAREKITIQPENQTLASITFQNYFRMYQRLSGMTGTALTEAEEFSSIYNLNVISIPTNLPVKREDEHDEIYRTKEEKYRAIVKEIREANQKGQPILVGTTSIEKSEDLAQILRDEGITNFKVLNARYHEQEAMIIAQAGHPGAITIATNMAGRGTDIQLGGNAEMRIKEELGSLPPGPERIEKEQEIRQQVRELRDQAIASGGLYVLATERHESRRIDNQLRGRAGRQGDPGRSKFYLSLHDDLMRIFGSEKMDTILVKLGLKENEAIIHPWINKALEKAQQKVEARNFDIRKNLLKYDDVMNDQRNVVFQQRLNLMDSDNIQAIILEMRENIIEEYISLSIPKNAYPEQWDIQGLENAIQEVFQIDLPIKQWSMEEGIAEQEIRTRLNTSINEVALERTQGFKPEILASIEKMVVLQTLDQLWREHISNLDHLRSVIGLRGYGQRNPLNEYKSEAFEMFQNMLVHLGASVTKQLMSLQGINNIDSERGNLTNNEQDNSNYSFDTDRMIIKRDVDIKTQEFLEEKQTEKQKKVSRNQLCPCGSKKKYKHCHGALG